MIWRYEDRLKADFYHYCGSPRCGILYGYKDRWGDFEDAVNVHLLADLYVEINPPYENGEGVHQKLLPNGYHFYKMLDYIQILYRNELLLTLLKKTCKCRNILGYFIINPDWSGYHEVRCFHNNIYACIYEDTDHNIKRNDFYNAYDFYVTDYKFEEFALKIDEYKNEFRKVIKPSTERIFRLTPDNMIESVLTDAVEKGRKKFIKEHLTEGFPGKLRYDERRLSESIEYYLLFLILNGHEFKGYHADELERNIRVYIEGVGCPSALESQLQRSLEVQYTALYREKYPGKYEDLDYLDMNTSKVLAQLVIKLKHNISELALRDYIRRKYYVLRKYITCCLMTNYRYANYTWPYYFADFKHMSIDIDDKEDKKIIISVECLKPDTDKEYKFQRS